MSKEYKLEPVVNKPNDVTIPYLHERLLEGKPISLNELLKALTTRGDSYSAAVNRVSAVRAGDTITAGTILYVWNVPPEKLDVVK